MKGFAGNALLKTECLSSPRSVVVPPDMLNWLLERFRSLGDDDIIAGATSAMVLLAHERGAALY